MGKRVLFLCTGNSCRSQMAEGFLRHVAGGKFEVCSAGVNIFRKVRDKIGRKIKEWIKMI